ncbi:MAG: tetratricopeptide repeat protein [Acidobacteria bacterium]|nr:MAG: tetratricopeptide repeat protein [Acidobacteriota bacterium]REK02043.1 MAG: tetratricopeptide repeat protein [Acidobacteriota bacterium]REK15001.1 MAG: tetratricopeptide repeat protein [Acidobacteriota bacterium]REK45715.1 MAG: tetratricopeptide repeat protein [Acidobacteriota bacterium]
MSFLQSKLVLLILLILSFGGTVLCQESLPDLVRRIKPSAVAIETFDASGNSITRGSGFFIAPNRIITNRHVIERSNRVEVHLNNGRKFTASGILAVDGEGDLALIEVSVPPELAPPLSIRDLSPEEGESIVVIGNPFGLEGSVSDGIVSAVREIPGYGKIIQITAPISPGSSGSPVVNMRGEVIGVATLQASEGQSLNFAVPSARIARLEVGELLSFSNANAENRQTRRALAERLYARGLANLSSDDYEQALPFFEQAVATDPTYAEAWYQVGFCYGMLEKHEQSVRASKKAAELRPEWPETHINIGASSFALGDFEQAAESYKTASRLDQSNAETHLALGLSLGKLGRTGEEILAYRRAVSARPDFANAIELLGLAYFKQKQYGHAIEAFEQLRNYKADADTYNLLGESYYAEKRFDESIDAFSTAVNMNPSNDRARYNLGRAYLKSGSRSLAQVQYEILAANQSDWADRLYILLNP